MEKRAFLKNLGLVSLVLLNGCVGFDFWRQFDKWADNSPGNYKKVICADAEKKESNQRINNYQHYLIDANYQSSKSIRLD